MAENRSFSSLATYKLCLLGAVDDREEMLSRCSLKLIWTSFHVIRSVKLIIFSRFKTVVNNDFGQQLCDTQIIKLMLKKFVGVCYHERMRVSKIRIRY